MIIRDATITDFEKLTEFVDKYFAGEGYGFINREQLKTEIKKRRVIVAENSTGIVGVRIGWNRLWNIVVHPNYRGQGIGRALIVVHHPEYIRVKSNPVGHLNKNQIANFKDPTEFYEKMGFVYVCDDYGKNFWAGDTKENTRIYMRKGQKKHIKLYRNPNKTWF